MTKCETQGLSISVVTAAWNMEHLVEETIRSVVSQKLPMDQYIFIDGASTDGTLSIARRFSDGIDSLVSEPDDGQYHAIAKGFDQATGDIQGWINADDVLMPWTFSVVREIFTRFPEIDWIIGAPSFLTASGQLSAVQTKVAAYPRRFIANGWFEGRMFGYLQQESMFWRRTLWDKAGGLDLSYRWAADFQLWTRFADHAGLVPLSIPLAAFRVRPGEQRSSSGKAEYDHEVARAKKRPAPLPLKWILNSNRLCKNLFLLCYSVSQTVVIFDDRAQDWRMIRRRRSISPRSLGSIVDSFYLGKMK